MFCTGIVFMGHHWWTITIYENGKLLLNLSLNNDTEIIKNKVSKNPIRCHKDS